MRKIIERDDVNKREFGVNYAKDRNRGRLQSLRKKVYKLEKEVNQGKARHPQLRKVIIEYTQTLELVYGKEDAQFFPHFRMNLETKEVTFGRVKVSKVAVEQYFPIIEAEKNKKTKNKKSSGRFSMPALTVEKIGGKRGFDSKRLAKEYDKATSVVYGEGSFTFLPLGNVKRGFVYFFIQDQETGEVLFHFNMELNKESKQGSKNNAWFIKTTQDLYTNAGYDVMICVNKKDYENGLIIPNDQESARWN